MSDFKISNMYHFNLEDAIIAKEEYEKILQMTYCELEFYRGLNIKVPLDKLLNDISQSTMAKALHLRKMIDSLEDLLTEYMVKMEAEIEN